MTSKWAAAAAAKSLQSCPTLCDPMDSSPPGSPVPGILQARTLEWVAISFSNDQCEKWKWSRSVMSDSSRPHGLQPTRLLHPWDFPDKSTGVGCHCLLYQNSLLSSKSINAYRPTPSECPINRYLKSIYPTLKSSPPCRLFFLCFLFQ